MTPPGGDRLDPSGLGRPPLGSLLRVLVITDSAAAAPRPVEEVVREALAGGARAIQLRAKKATGRELLGMARRLRGLTKSSGALLIVNDRMDVALAASADGVHLGAEDLSVAAVKTAAPPGFLVGFSTDDPEEAVRAEAEGADYLGCGAVWATSTKDVGDEAIGIDRLDQVCRTVRIPVVAIGGITPARALEVARTRAAGVAVVGAVMAAADPRAVVSALLEPFLRR